MSVQRDKQCGTAMCIVPCKVQEETCKIKYLGEKCEMKQGHGAHYAHQVKAK